MNNLIEIDEKKQLIPDLILEFKKVIQDYQSLASSDQFYYSDLYSLIKMIKDIKSKREISTQKQIIAPDQKVPENRHFGGQ